MLINTKRVVPSFVAGDVVTGVVRKLEVSGDNLSCMFEILNNGKPTEVKIYHTFGSYAGKGRYFFEKFLDAIGVDKDSEQTDERWFIGKHVEFMLKDNEWNGKKYLAVDSFLVKAQETSTTPSFSQSKKLENADICFTEEQKPKIAQMSDKPTKKKFFNKGKTELTSVNETLFDREESSEPVVGQDKSKEVAF